MRVAGLFIALVALVLLVQGQAAASLSGEAEWSIANYRTEVDGEGVSEASHFTQRYSLVWKRSGLIQRGAGGHWQLALGAEWNALSADVDGEDISLDSFKPLYEGDILIAPGGLPFRFHAYSRDMHRTSFLRDTVTSTGVLFQPDIATDMLNGQHIQSGVTFLLGIRNGSYLGRYRDVLSQLPRVLMDYSEDYVRNLRSNLPQHFRTRNLAFVSLNKKDNWFHYRHLDFTDYITPSNNYSEKRYTLGTIDHRMERQWINLTNWIRISADGTYTNSQKEIISGQEEKRYDVNMFATLKRTPWQAATFSGFQREMNDSRLRKSLEAPFYLRGEFNRNTAWGFTFIGQRAQEKVFTDSTQIDEDDLFASVRAETFRQGRFILEPKFDVEVRGGDRGEGGATRAGFEFYSNRRHRPRFDLFGAYSIAFFHGTPEGGSEGDYWEQEARGQISTDVSARFRTGITQDLLFGSGDSARVTRHIVPHGDMGLTLTGGGGETIESQSGKVFQSSTTWFGDFRLTSRLDNRLEVTYEYQKREADNNSRFDLRHDLRYQLRDLAISANSNLIILDREVDLPPSNSSGTAMDDRSVSGTKRFTHNAVLSYSPGSVWNTTAKVRYAWTSGDKGDTSNWDVEQKTRYSFFSKQGFARKLGEISEKLEYERYTNFGGDTGSVTSITLDGDYFPTRRIRLGASLRYRTARVDDLTYTLVAALDFAKLQIHLNYSAGTSFGGSASTDADVQRWEVAVRKIF